MKNKKAMSGWMWILIFLILIVIGAILVFSLFGGGDSGSIVGGLGSSVPSPPALPN